MSGPAEGSKAPAWTPPIPPVAKTRIPAAWAASIVAETVVAPQPPAVSAPASVGRATLRTPGVVASASSAVVVEAHEDPAVADGDRRGHGAALADGGLRRRGHLHVLRVREAVADERGFEGHDGPAGGERVGDLGGDVEAGAQGGEAGSSGMSAA